MVMNINGVLTTYEELTEHNFELYDAFDKEGEFLLKLEFRGWPHAVAEHAMALLLTVNRHTHKAHNRTREFNFSLQGLTGFDLYGKTVGIIGTGKIGKVFADICRGFGMKILAYDKYPNPELGLSYVSLEELFERSDILSLHCPLTEETNHLINAQSIAVNAYNSD